MSDAATKRFPLTPLSKRGRRMVLKADDGHPLLVLRPQFPLAAVRVAKKALETQDGALLDKLPEDAGNYTVQGWLGEKGRLLDRDGNVIGKCEIGDSFITLGANEEEGLRKITRSC